MKKTKFARRRKVSNKIEHTKMFIYSLIMIVILTNWFCDNVRGSVIFILAIIISFLIGYETKNITIIYKQWKAKK